MKPTPLPAKTKLALGIADPRLSSVVRALSPARTKRFDSCQVQLGTRSAIFAVGQHFVQGTPFAIPTAPGADLLDRLRARVPSEVAPETLLCRRSYRQAVRRSSRESSSSKTDSIPAYGLH